METIRKYPAIYNKECQDFRNKLMKENCWQQVAAKLNFNKEDVPSIKTRYQSLRTKFSKYILGLKAASGSGADDVTIKASFESMRWLLNHITHRTTCSNTAAANNNNSASASTSAANASATAANNHTTEVSIESGAEDDSEVCSSFIINQ